MFIQHIRFGSNTDEGSHGIKQVNKQEREHNCDEIQAQQAGEIHLHQCRFQRRDAKTAGKIRQYRIHSQFWIRLINTSYLQKDAQQPCAQNAQQNTARYFFNHKSNSQDNPNECQQCTNAFRPESAISQRRFEGINRNQCGAVHHQFGILETDESDKQTNTAGNTGFQRHGDTVKDCFSHICQGKHDEYDPFHKYCCQCHMPGEAHLPYNCISKKSVQAHAGCQCKGIVGKCSHHQCCQTGCQRRCRKYRAAVHSRR